MGDSPAKPQSVVLGAQGSLRVLTVATTVSATWLMMTNKQTISLGGFVMDARYSYDPAAKFFVIANIIVCACTALSLPFLFYIGRKGSTPTHYFVLFLNDLLMLCLVVAGCAAATATGYVGKYGNQHTGWMAICGQFGKFCKRESESIIFSCVSAFCLLMLTVMSANKSRQREV